MKIKPCGAHLLIQLEEVKETNDGSIIIKHTKTQQEREQEGKNMGRVVALGPFLHADWDGFKSDDPKEKAKEWGYELGDLVCFARYDGIKYDLPNCENYRLIHSSSILGKVEES